MSGHGDIAAVIAVLGPDLTAPEWAVRLGVSLLDVRGIAAIQGVELADESPDRDLMSSRRSDRALTVAQEEALVLAYRGGMQVTRLATAFGVSPATVYGLVKEAA